MVQKNHTNLERAVIVQSAAKTRDYLVAPTEEAGIVVVKTCDGDSKQWYITEGQYCTCSKYEAIGSCNHIDAVEVASDQPTQAVERNSKQEKVYKCSCGQLHYKHRDCPNKGDDAL